MGEKELRKVNFGEIGCFGSESTKMKDILNGTWQAIPDNF